MTRSFPDSFGGRLGWVVRESTVVLTIALFWVVVGVALTLVLGGVGVALRLANLGAFRLLYEFASGGLVWGLVTPLAGATTLLYVVVRAGTVLVERYRRA
ncbi:MAG: hypothetical protein ABEJ80_08370 [Halarchaeum sp.]